MKYTFALDLMLVVCEDGYVTGGVVTAYAGYSSSTDPENWSSACG